VFMKKIIKSVCIKIVLWLSKSYSIYLLISAIVFAFLIVAVMSKQLGFTEVFELSAFSAVLLESTLITLSTLLCKQLANKVEDPSKLNCDYDNLVDLYCDSKGNMLIDDNGKYIPVIFETSICDKNIEINDCPSKEYQLPQIAVQYYEHLLSAHQTSNIYNNINVRVSEWHETNSAFVISTGRTTYYNGLVTNRAMDYEIEKGITIRQLYECGPYIHKLEHSVLSNHLGFNGFLESEDHFFAFVYRQKNTSIGKRTWGNSVGACLKSKYALKDNLLSIEGLENGFLSEFEDEIKIKRQDLNDIGSQLRKIIVISAYRDLVEGGKPQLFVYAKSNLGKNDIDTLFKRGTKETKNRIRKSSNSREKTELEMSTDGDRICWISRYDILNNITILTDRIIHNGKEMLMMPSAVVCVLMLRDYLSKQIENNVEK